MAPSRVGALSTDRRTRDITSLRSGHVVTSTIECGSMEPAGEARGHTRLTRDAGYATNTRLASEHGVAFPPKLEAKP